MKISLARILFLAVALLSLFCFASCKGKEQCKINYVLGGGENSPSNPTEARGTVTLHDPEKPAFEFLGWYADESLTSRITEISVKGKESVTVYAKWGEAQIDALIISPNGAVGSAQARALQRGDAVILPENTFVKNGYSFVGWAESPSGEPVYMPGDEYVMDDTSARVLYAAWERIEGKDTSLSLSTNIDYEKYYVADSLLLAADFFGITEKRNETNPILGSSYYEQTSAAASKRFTADPDNYTHFISHSAGEVSISGGTAKIVSPWCFNNWYSDYEKKMGTGSLSDMRTSLPSENVASVNVSGGVYTVSYNDETSESYTVTTEQGTTVYSTSTMVEGVTDYYISDGKWAKKIYASEWGEGCIVLGQNSTIAIDGLYAFLKAGGEDYTVQVVSSFESENSSGTVYMLGMARYSVGAVTKGGEKHLSYRSMAKSYGGSGSTKAFFSSFITDALWYGINDNTFTFDRDYQGTGEGITKYKIYVNGKQCFTHFEDTSSVDGTIKIGEGQSTKLYAVRVYSRVLTEDEIHQNHFIDLASYHSLDISKYVYADAEKRNEIHAHFKNTGFDSDASALQAELDAFFPRTNADGIVFIEFKANYGGFDTISEQYAINGFSVQAPDVSLGGSDFLGWAESPDSNDVVYKADDTIKPSSDTTLYAVWKHYDYKISYDAAGGTLSGEARADYTTNTDVFALPNAVRDGYVFCGWYKDDALTLPIDEIGYGVSGDLTLHAGWAKNADTLFEINLSDTLNDISGTYNADFTDNANVLDKFKKSVAELPEEITVLPRIDVTSYLVSNRNQFYVSPDGDDKNDGSINYPFKTIAEALHHCRGLDGAVIWVRGGDYYLDDTVTVNSTHSGTPTSPLIISAYGDEKPVLYTAKNIPTSAFSAVPDSDAYASRFPVAAKSSIVVANLRELGWTDADMGAITTESGAPSLFINNEKMDLARFPNSNEDPLYINLVYDTGSVTSRDGSSLYEGWMQRVGNWERWSAANGGSYEWDITYYDQNTYKNKRLYSSEAEAIADAKKLDDAIKAGARLYTDSYGNTNIDYGWSIKLLAYEPFEWQNDGNIWYYGNTFAGWEYGYYQIKDFDLSRVAMNSVGGSVYGANVSSNSPTGHNDYYLFNIPEALDAPGEWYLDYKTGNLYIYRTQDFDSAKITYSSTNTVDALVVSYAENVIINGIGIDSTSGIGIRASASSNVVIQGCTVKNTGKAGISIGGCKYSAVIYNDVSRANGNMIYAGDSSSSKTLTPTIVVVQNNVCHSPLESKQGGISLAGCRTVVSHNTLYDCQISFGTATECIIEYNELNGGSQYVSDSGMIYTNGYYSFGNHIRYNYLYNWGTPGNGVYFDDLSSCNYAYYNIMDSSTKEHSKATGFCYTSTGHYNVFYGNVLVGRSVDRINQSALYLNRKASLGYRWAGLSQTYVNSFSRNYDADMLAKRFPEILNYLKMMSTHVNERAEAGYVRNELEIYLRSPANNIVKNNVVVGTSVCFNQPILKEEDGTILPHTDYVGENYHSTSYEGVFADFANGDFTINGDVLNEIKAVIPDFVPLSTEKCGTTY